ncbi:MAG: ATP-dependent metallopeptidase FtsH/Yme1/Tma family protein, partial [Lachnospiraceae bacterium]
MDNQNKPNNKKDPKNGKQGWAVIILTTLITAFLVLGLYQLMQGGTDKEISYSKFLKMVDNKEVKKVVFDAEKLI